MKISLNEVDLKAFAGGQAQISCLSGGHADMDETSILGIKSIGLVKKRTGVYELRLVGSWRLRRNNEGLTDRSLSPQPFPNDYRKLGRGRLALTFSFDVRKYDTPITTDEVLKMPTLECIEYQRVQVGFKEVSVAEDGQGVSFSYYSCEHIRLTSHEKPFLTAKQITECGIGRP